jgi:hypothetical protein
MAAQAEQIRQVMCESRLRLVRQDDVGQKSVAVSES